MLLQKVHLFGLYNCNVNGICMFSALKAAVLLSGILLANPAFSTELTDLATSKENLLIAAKPSNVLPAHILSGITTKILIDKHLSFEWCTHNLVAPLGVEDSSLLRDKRMIIAVGNIEYLGVIGDFLIRKLANDGYKVMFIELPEEIIVSLIHGS